MDDENQSDYVLTMKDRIYVSFPNIGYIPYLDRWGPRKKVLVDVPDLLQIMEEGIYVEIPDKWLSKLRDLVIRYNEFVSKPEYAGQMKKSVRALDTLEKKVHGKVFDPNKPRYDQKLKLNKTSNTSFNIIRRSDKIKSVPRSIVNAMNESIKKHNGTLAEEMRMRRLRKMGIQEIEIDTMKTQEDFRDKPIYEIFDEVTRKNKPIGDNDESDSEKYADEDFYI